MFKLLILTSILLALASEVISSSKALSPLKPSEPYTHTASIDEDDLDLYRLYWKPTNETIQFEIHCRTTGWVGLGFSQNGDMAGSDIVIGWVDDITGAGHVKDTYAKIRAAPVMDKIQDWELLDAKQIDGYTILKIKRKLNTCDKDEDMVIKKETNYLVAAWNAADPITGNGDWKYHGTNRRIKVDMLLGFKDVTVEEEIDDSLDAIKVDLRLNNVSI